jgi:hypothetical protein
MGLGVGIASSYSSNAPQRRQAGGRRAETGKKKPAFPYTAERQRN